MSTLYESWAERSPRWERRYESSVILPFCEYGRGATNARDYRGRVFGAGYEMYIIAFFLGLYANQRRPLTEILDNRKTFGVPIKDWGNSGRAGRKAYPKIREYIFTALVARTDIDFIDLEKGKITSRKAVDLLTQTMEEYANWGFHFMADKLEDNPSCLYNETAFLELFLAFKTSSSETAEEIEPEPLD